MTTLRQQHCQVLVTLAIQDFRTVCEYNSIVYKITFQQKLCGENITNEDMLENTLTNFHVPNMVLQKPYCKRIFKKYYDLIICLLMAEQYNTLLLKNHEARSHWNCSITGSTPLSEVNMVEAYGQLERKNKN